MLFSVKVNKRYVRYTHNYVPVYSYVSEIMKPDCQSRSAALTKGFGYCLSLQGSLHGMATPSILQVCFTWLLQFSMSPCISDTPNF